MILRTAVQKDHVFQATLPRNTLHTYARAHSHRGLIDTSALATSAPAITPVTSRDPPSSTVPASLFNCSRGELGNVIMFVKHLREVEETPLESVASIALCCSEKPFVRDGATSAASSSCRRMVSVDECGTTVVPKTAVSQV